jgi:PEP-CTERM motif-containing protein
MTRRFTWPAAAALAVQALIMPATVVAAPITFSAAGLTPASIQGAVDAFRAALGDPNNGNNPGPLAGGRREINWDGGGGVFATTTPVTPFDVFLNTRGAQFTTPGTGLTQAPPSADPALFPPGGLAGLFGNANYDDEFSTFSPARLFAPAGSNATNGAFFLPGSNGSVPARVAGFGAVFTDVDLPGKTSIEFFNVFGASLGTFPVPASPGIGTLSFLGVLFADEQIRSVLITTGNSPLGPNDGAGIDVVAMDDFLYAEPQAVPEPATLSLLLLGAGGLAAVRRRMKGKGAARTLKRAR